MDVYVIPVKVKNTIINIKIHNIIENELRTCIKIDITSDIPWNNEDTQQTYMITPYMLNDMLGD